MDLRKLLQMSGMGAAPTGQDTEVVDTSESIQISSLALLKMLKHGIIQINICFYFLTSSRTRWCSHGSDGFNVGHFHR